MALARGSCLYCGAALDAGQVAAAVASAAAALAGPAAEPGPERHLLVLAVDGATREALASALGLSAFEAEQRLRRGGHQLHRIAEAGASAAEADRLRSCGLSAVIVPEAEARAAARPRVALGGTWERDALTLRFESGAGRVRGGDLLLVVRGPIARAQEPSERLERVRLTTPEDGHRIHLHLRDEREPLELDPEAFEFGTEQGAGSSLVKLLGWVSELARGVPVDEGFARLTPALGPATPATGAVAGAALAMAGSGRGRRKEPALFDNLAQFRFYSGWRAAVERRRGRPSS